VRAVGLLAIILLVACARDPEEALCPDIEVGDLIVTEVRGPQTPEDAANGEWIELFNASARSIDLRGITVRFRKKDGSSEVRVIVREATTVAAGEYVVLGLFLNTMRPAHVNYGFATDFNEDWLGAAAIDVESCGTRIDRSIYDSLPKLGSYSFTGAMAPETNANDDLRNWCTNAAASGAVFPGSPQQANPPCP
jgi:hypothetical protein